MSRGTGSGWLAMVRASTARRVLAPMFAAMFVWSLYGLWQLDRTLHSAVRDPAEMLTHHLLDSLAAVAPQQKHLQGQGLSAACLLDVGAGAGGVTACDAVGGARGRDVGAPRALRGPRATVPAGAAAVGGEASARERTMCTAEPFSMPRKSRGQM